MASSEIENTKAKIARLNAQYDILISNPEKFSSEIQAVDRQIQLEENKLARLRSHPISNMDNKHSIVPSVSFQIKPIPFVGTSVDLKTDKKFTFVPFQAPVAMDAGLKQRYDLIDSLGLSPNDSAHEKAIAYKEWKEEQFLKSGGRYFQQKRVPQCNCHFMF